MENSGWNEMKDRFLPIDHDRVTGVRPALKAHDQIHGRREKIDYLTFPLIAPLHSDDDDIRHWNSFLISNLEYVPAEIAILDDIGKIFHYVSAIDSDLLIPLFRRLERKPFK